MEEEYVNLFQEQFTHMMDFISEGFQAIKHHLNGMAAYYSKTFQRQDEVLQRQDQIIQEQQQLNQKQDKLENEF